MKILLINPLIKNDGVFTEGMDVNLGLYSLKEVAVSQGHSVKVVNTNKYSAVDKVREHEPDIVGITCMSPQFPAAVRIAEKAKCFDENITTVVGGYYPTLCVERFEKEELPFDHVFVGEAERSWERFLERVEEGKENPFIVESIPFDIGEYPIPYKREGKQLILQASRGCPYDCRFCTIKSFYGRRFKNRDVERIIDLVREKSEDGVDTVHFTDDSMFTDREFARKLFEGFEEMDADLSIILMARLDDFLESTELVGLMERAGVARVGIGVQNFDEDVLKNYNVHFGMDQVNRFLSYIKEYEGPMIFSFFYILDPRIKGQFGGFNDYIRENFPEEDYDSIRITLFCLSPYPGSEIADEFPEREVDYRYNNFFYYYEKGFDGILDRFTGSRKLLREKNLTISGRMYNFLNHVPGFFFLFYFLDTITCSFPLRVRLKMLKKLLMINIKYLRSDFIKKDLVYRHSIKEFF